jgi:hypothetical protein
MKASEMIVKLRSRLRDEAKEGWSDLELLDTVNLALSAISHDFMIWKKRWSTLTSSGVDTYSIPEDFMAPISLMVGGVIVPIKGVEYALQDGTDSTCAFIDINSLILYPLPMSEVNVILNYHAVFQSDTVDSILKIGIEHVDTVMYYALSQALQKEASEDSLAKSKYYLSLYKDRIKVVAKITHQRRNTSGITSRFQKV